MQVDDETQKNAAGRGSRNLEDEEFMPRVHPNGL
jgi:hypothetical protein